MKPPKIISYIKGVKHWDCYICQKMLPASDYSKTSNPISSPHASYCKECARAASRKAYVPKPKAPYKAKGHTESDHEILKALQAFDPSWTMEKLNMAKTQVTQ